MVYHNIKPACMLLVKYNDAGSRPCMTWYTLIYCRPLLWEHLLRFGSSSSSRLWSSSLQIVVTTMILFSEEWERVAGYRFPQQSVTPLVARSLDGHTAHFTNHTAQQHRATAHTDATLFTLLDYTLPSSLAMLCHNMCDTLWEQSDYNIIFNHCSPVHTGQWPHSTFPQMATLEHSSAQFWWPCFLPRFLSRNFQSESQTQSLILYSLQFALHLQINHKKTETWFHLFICT